MIDVYLLQELKKLTTAADKLYGIIDIYSGFNENHILQIIDSSTTFTFNIDNQSAMKYKSMKKRTEQLNPINILKMYPNEFTNSAGSTCGQQKL